MLSKTQAGYYKIRFRVNPKLESFFKKKEINKVLNTNVYEIAKVKADIIRQKYQDLLKVSRVLERKQIQELVNNYIIDVLEQDLIDRATYGQGTVFTTVDKSNPETSTLALASANMCDLLKSDYLKDLSNCRYSLIENTVDELLEKNQIKVDKKSDNYRMLSYYMMLAQVEILQEASRRGYGRLPNHPKNIVKKIFGEMEIKKASNLKEELPEQKETKEFTSYVSLRTAIDKYLKYYKHEAKKKGTKDEQINEVCTHLTDCFLKLFGEDRDVLMMTIEDMMDYSELLSSFPSRKGRPYNKISIKEIAEQVKNEEIPEDFPRLTESTVNKYLGYIKAFFEYMRKSGTIDINPMSLMRTGRTSSGNDREQRLELSKEEIHKLIELTKDRPEYQNAVKILYTSGMRLSELYKFQLKEIDGIKVFDLTNKELNLKTKSSYRIIPVHSSVDISLIEKLHNQATLSRNINALIRESISEDKRKVLYSLRHSFATHLKNNRIDSTIVSELMGHSHNSITYDRYAGTYDVSILKDAIESLKI